MPAPTNSASGTPVEHVGHLGRVLGVWAHPDDETYLSGGLMAAATSRGQHVACLTVTDGEHGTADPHRWPPTLLAAERRRELNAALDVLGVDEQIRLGYEDGTLSTADPDAGVERILAVMRDVEPDTVVTFGPDGITGHPDHRTVSAWTTSAAVLYGCADVVFAAKTHAWLAEFEHACTQVSMFEPGFPHPVDASDLALELDLDDAALDLKVAALERHATQVGAAIAVLGRTKWRELVRRESFRFGLAGFGAPSRRIAAAQ